MSEIVSIYEIDLVRSTLFSLPMASAVNKYKLQKKKKSKITLSLISSDFEYVKSIQTQYSFNIHILPEIFDHDHYI